MRPRWTLMPVRPTMSARAMSSKSIGVTFSSTMRTRCGGGVSAASRGRLATGIAARLPRSGSARSRPQYDASKRGLTSTMSAPARSAIVRLQLECDRS